MTSNLKLNIEKNETHPKIRVVSDGKTLAELDKIAIWCDENDCGNLNSNNEFTFQNYEEMFYFIQRWS